MFTVHRARSEERYEQTAQLNSYKLKVTPSNPANMSSTSPSRSSFIPQVVPGRRHPPTAPVAQAISKVNQENDTLAATAARQKQLLEQNLNNLRLLVSSTDEDNWMFLNTPSRTSSTGND